MKIGITLSTIPTQFGPIVFSSGDFYENLRTAKDLGYDGVDLFTHKLSQPEEEKIIATLTTLDLQAALLLPIWLTEGGSFLSDPDVARRGAAVERYKSQIEVAARMGANMAIGYSRGNQQEKESEETYQDRLAQSLKEVSEFADSKSVSISLEPINRYEINTFHRADQTLDFLEKYQLDSIQVLLDTFHMNIEERSLEAAIERCGARIGQVHITDSNRLAPGDGHLDYDRIIEALVGVGFEGFLSIEALPEPSAVQCASRGIAFLQSKLKSPTFATEG